MAKECFFFFLILICLVVEALYESFMRTTVNSKGRGWGGDKLRSFLVRDEGGGGRLEGLKGL